MRNDFTRAAPDGWAGHRGRIDEALIAESASCLTSGIAFVCGSNGFVESATGLLLQSGFEPQRIRTERFGPTGQP